MTWVAIGILVGIIVGLNTSYEIPIEYTKYTAIIIVGILDSLFGAVRAEVTKEEYDPLIFITGLIFNIILAIGITYLGEKLGLDLYLAAAVVFTFRIFSNLGIIRRSLLKIRVKNKRLF
jgi:small basic protein